MAPGVVLVVSSVNLDITLTLPKFPSEGETILGTKDGPRLGGKGANVAVAVARSGIASARFCGSIGEDGKSLLSQLEQNGVDTALVRLLPSSATGAAYILLDEQGRNRIIVVAGANSDFRPPKELSSAMPGAVVVLQLEIDLSVTRNVAMAAKNAGATVVLNPSPIPSSSGPFAPDDEAWRSVDVVVLNDIEAGQLTGVTNGSAEQAVRVLRTRCSKDVCVVVTLGDKGVLFAEASDKDVRLVPAVYVERVVDTTGAGDTFTGFLAAGIAAKLEFERCVRNAVAAAAISVTRKGAADAIPTRREVLEWMAKQREQL